MDRWTGVLRVPVQPNRSPAAVYCRVAASLRLSAVPPPSANLMFFTGDRVEGSGNPVVDRLSDLSTIADVLVSKFGPSSNAWVIEAPAFHGPFSVYREFVPGTNRYGEPKSYDPSGLPASASLVSLLRNCLVQVEEEISKRKKDIAIGLVSSPLCCLPRTIILGFSKGGTVINQLVAELSQAEVLSLGLLCGRVPSTKEELLNSIEEVHYVDVGLNSSGAYITDGSVITRIAERVARGGKSIRFILHGTPRQWGDKKRAWIRREKDRLLRLLDSASRQTDRRITVTEKLYFADRPPDLQMHFEIIEKLEVDPVAGS
ncbi:hypothetical protein MLD38_010883 [Melastoma candidum]|uniref:Uncharacterized protein n=1 Tax=Melastoma candidum TaxID=119954 RepID=A0ACB9R2E7_9MYRT|nr:hypothetical protein MLD38_010883 [Melastoma candidum]